MVSVHLSTHRGNSKSNNNNHNNSAANRVWPNGYLMTIVIFQWFFIIYLLRSNNDSHAETTQHTVAAHPISVLHNKQSDSRLFVPDSVSNTELPSLNNNNSNNSTSTAIFSPDGVAVAVLFRAPRWFHLRFLHMLHNALINLPRTWMLQVFVNADWVSSELQPWHPGLPRLFQHPRVNVTTLPKRLCQGRSKKVVFLDPWFWDALLADAVLLFSGNGAFCGNTVFDWSLLQQLDYCGVPNGRPGGDGSTHSYRNRRAMVRVLEYAAAAKQEGQREHEGSEDHFFLHYLQEMNQKGRAEFRLATVEQTVAFGGVANLSSDKGLQHLPLVVSGTQPGLSWTERDGLLKHCPEIKMIFPSMHEPACFGAHPDPVKCRQSICALQDPIPPQGC